MMQEAIKNFPKQLAWEPAIENFEGLEKKRGFIVAGMGGSHLAADLLPIVDPAINLGIHKDYGLPVMPDSELKNYLLIASSYSGNTEETIDAFLAAGKKKMARAVVSIGGKLLELAQKEKVPYVRVPDTKIQPRSALGFVFKSLLKLMGNERALSDVGKIVISPAALEPAGKALAERLKGFVPVIYASQRNAAIANNWKIKFNETGKVPAFHNVFPEVNHNEMTGFDIQSATQKLIKPFYFIILKDAEDPLRIQKRMEILAGLYKDRGLSVETIMLSEKNVYQRIFSSLILADWTAFYTAIGYGTEPEQVPMVEEFKRLINS